MTGDTGHGTISGIATAPRTPILDAAIAILAAERLPAEMRDLLLFPVRGLTSTESERSDTL